MTEHTALPMEYERGFRDAAGYPGDHYTIDDDFLTIYMGKDAIENFDPEKHDWAEVHGPNQEANARFIVTACNGYAKLLKGLKRIADYENKYNEGRFTSGDAYDMQAIADEAIRHVEEQA